MTRSKFKLRYGLEVKVKSENVSFEHQVTLDNGDFVLTYLAREDKEGIRRTCNS